MARFGLLFLACTICVLPIARPDDLPFMDMAATLLQAMGAGKGESGNNMDGLAAIGSVIGNLMQGDNAKNLGALLGQNGGGNAGDLLSGKTYVFNIKYRDIMVYFRDRISNNILFIIRVVIRLTNTKYLYIIKTE